MSSKLPHSPQLLAQLRNPLLSNLVNAEKLLFEELPLHGRHINATFSRDKKVVQECLNRASATRAANKRPNLSDEVKQMALDSGIIVVYQAFNRGIVKFAAENQTFLGCPLYNPTRMTWIKTAFFWMMFRCEWATRDINQERVVAITLPLAFFDQILKMTVESSHGTGGGSNEEGKPQQQESAAVSSEKTKLGGQEAEQKSTSKAAAAAANTRKPSRNDPVRLQFDPAHTELGGKRDRREIQLGLRGNILPEFHKWMVCVDDITDSLVAPCRPKEFDSNKSWMENYVAPTPAPASVDEKETKKEESVATTEEKKNENDDDAEQEKNTSSSSCAASTRRSLIYQPLEELYVPLDSAIVDHLRLDIVVAESPSSVSSSNNTMKNVVEEEESK